eukprot:gene11128-12127_t
MAFQSDQAIEYAGLIIQPPKNIVELNNTQSNQMRVDGNLVTGEVAHVPPPEEKVDLIIESFSEMVTDYPVDRKVPLVVLDCANIGWNYGNDAFSAYGLQLVISYFKQYHVEIKAFIPSMYVQKKLIYNNGTSNTNALMQTDDIDILQGLVFKKMITLVPPGDSDDAYIINYARNYSGFIISNDYFNDHLNSLTNTSMKLSMKLFLTENRISYTFVGKDNFFINPNSLLSNRLEIFHKDGKTNNGNSNERNGSGMTLSAASPRSHSSNLNHLQKSLQFLSKAINELNYVQKYSEMKQLILMKAKLYFEIQLFQESFEEIQNILLYIDENCSEAKYILKLLQERANNTKMNKPSSVPTQPQAPTPPAPSPRSQPSYPSQPFPTDQNHQRTPPARQQPQQIAFSSYEQSRSSNYPPPSPREQLSSPHSTYSNQYKPPNNNFQSYENSYHSNQPNNPPQRTVPSQPPNHHYTQTNSNHNPNQQQQPPPHSYHSHYNR